MMSKKRKKKRQHEAKVSNIEPREPAAMAQVVQVVQTTARYESGLDAILRRARERAMQQLRERAVGGR